MNTPTHDTYREWLHLAPDGELRPAEKSGLERHLAACAKCRDEAARVSALDRLLSASVIPVAPEFTAEVLRSLPPAGWEARGRRAWLPALAASALLAVTAALLAGLGGGAAGVPGAAAVSAVADLFRTTLLAGAGLLDASWRGLGLALGELLRGSPLQLGLLAVLVLGLDVLFVRLLIRTARRAAAADSRDRRERRG